MAKTTVCNICASGFDEWDESEGFNIRTALGYGTKFDGDYLELDICCKCMESLIESCKISPLKESIDNIVDPYMRLIGEVTCNE